MITEILKRIHTLAQQGNTMEALDEMYDELDTLLEQNNFEQCDEILRLVDVDIYPMYILIGFLTITLPARDKLPARQQLYDKIRVRLINERVERVLVGL